jgi:hypothetical protein
MEKHTVVAVDIAKSVFEAAVSQSAAMAFSRHRPGSEQRTRPALQWSPVVVGPGDKAPVSSSLRSTCRCRAKTY